MSDRASDAGASDLPAEGEATLKKLTLALRGAVPGQLVFVELGPAAQRKELAEALQSVDLGKSMSYVNLAAYPGDGAVIPLLRSLIADTGPVDILLLDGLESRMQDPGQTRRTVEELNLAREALSSLGPAIVFLVPPYVVDELRARALDLWTWRAYHFPIRWSSSPEGGMPAVPAMLGNALGGAGPGAGHVVDALGRSWEEMRATDMSFHDLLHAAALPYLRALLVRGRYGEARDVLEEVAGRGYASTSPLDQAELDEIRAVCLFMLNKGDAARPLFERVLATRMSAPGQSPESIVWPALNLNIILREQGLYAEAEARLQEALRSLGEMDHDALDADGRLYPARIQAALSLLYLETGRTREARVCLEAAHEAWKREARRPGIQAALLALELASAYGMLGDERMALTLLEEAIEKLGDTLGNDSPMVAWLQTTLDTWNGNASGQEDASTPAQATGSEE